MLEIYRVLHILASRWDRNILEENAVKKISCKLVINYLFQLYPLNFRLKDACTVNVNVSRWNNKQL